MTGYKQTLLYIIYIHIPYQITMFYWPKEGENVFCVLHLVYQ